MVLRGFHSATRDPAVIRRWWSRDPYANIGAPPPDGVFLVDCDYYRNEDLDDELRDLGIEWTPTLAAETPGGGLHRYYRHPPDFVIPNATNVCEVRGFDTRATGSGYGVLPPSRIDGVPYRWRGEPNLDRVVMAPNSLLCLFTLDPNRFPTERRSGRRLTAPKLRPAGWSDPAKVIFGVEEGERNARIFAACCLLRGMGADDVTLTRFAVAAAERALPSLPRSEALAIARSAARYPIGSPSD